jgi:hypothetical protein
MESAFTVIGGTRLIAPEIAAATGRLTFDFATQ